MELFRGRFKKPANVARGLPDALFVLDQGDAHKAVAILAKTRARRDGDLRALHQPPDVGVKVGEGDTAAVVQLADVDAVAHFLTELAAARAAHVGHPDAGGAA